MSAGAKPQWEDNITDVDAANLNSMALGGNVFISPNGGLNFRVTALRFERVDFSAHSVTFVDFAAVVADQLIGASTTTRAYIDAAGALQTTTGAFPADAFPLAEIVTDISSITSIIDKRPEMAHKTPRYSFWTKLFRRLMPRTSTSSSKRLNG